MTNLQRLIKSLTNNSLHGIAIVLVIAGAALFALGTVFSASLFTLGSLLAVVAGAVVAVIAFIHRNLK